MSSSPENEPLHATEAPDAAKEGTVPLEKAAGYVPVSPSDSLPESTQAAEASAQPGVPAGATPGEGSPRESETAPVPPPVFASLTALEVQRPRRIPHLGHVALLFLILVGGFAAALILMLTALHFHFYGITSIEQTKSEIHYTLGSEGLGYLFTLLGCLMVFPLLWNKPFFTGLHWNGATALRLRWQLVGAAFVCFLLALLNSVILPGPQHTPIEQIFREPGAAWLLFGFGVTLAPFFEEMFFRGFLLPAFCTAFDWVAERASKPSDVSAGNSERPQWKTGAILVATAATAVPFAATCALASKNYRLIGILLLVAWSCTAALIWTLMDRRPSALPASAPLDAGGQPVWSFSAMASIAVFTSVPFALMHAPQTGFSVGPFLLLVSVSVVLCAARLWTRSLAASTLLHASYNFMLFSMMLVGTHGFRHMEKL